MTSALGVQHRPDIRRLEERIEPGAGVDCGENDASNAGNEIPVGASEQSTAGVAADHVGLVARMTALLAVPLRIRILCALVVSPRTVSELQAFLSAPQPTVSHHLGLLLAGGLVTRRRAGRTAVYALGPRARGEGNTLVIRVGPLHVDLRVPCD